MCSVLFACDDIAVIAQAATGAEALGLAGAPNAPAATAGFLEALTRREADVLHLVAIG
jgi:hypothetical protein